MLLELPIPKPQDRSPAVGASRGSGRLAYVALAGRLEELIGGLCLGCLQPAGCRQTVEVLALITLFQYVEGLPDQQAVAAWSTREDWRSALHLPDDGPALECAELEAFRRHLQTGAAGQQAFQDLLRRLQAIGIWVPCADTPTPPTTEAVLYGVRMLNRLEWCVETMRSALQRLAAQSPEWLMGIIPPDWYDRYDPESIQNRLPHRQDEQEAMIGDIASDAAFLLAALEKAPVPEAAWLPEMLALQDIWH